ncbi:hypothetical protein N665_0343s0003 [Sinapis alba]|nr:hypothetical protein N665_0343s0003 [Sinapis alba]
MKRLPVALLLILLAFFSSNFHTDGHVDLQTSMEKSIGGSLRRIPKSRYSPIQNNLKQVCEKCGARLSPSQLGKTDGP